MFNYYNNVIKKIIIILLFIINNIAYGSDFIINKIVFEGLHRISSDTILHILPLKIGNLISSNDVSDSIKILFSTGYFEEISIFNIDCNTIMIKVKEYPVINSIKFYKNKSIKTEIIQEILNSKNIKIGTPLRSYSIFTISHELKAIYHDFGKFNATVQIDTVMLSRNRVDLKLIFLEGKTAKIDQINIFGNRSFSQKQLLYLFKINQQMKWGNVIFNKKYQKQRLFFGLEKLRIFYLNHGYAQFSINDIHIGLTSDKENVCISLYINEGEKYSFESLVIHGNVLNYIPKIKKMLYIKPGRLFNDNQIKKIEHNIHYVLGKKGYIKSILSMEYDFDDQNKTIKLHVFIDVGSQHYVREIFFEGNNLTQDFVIRREIQQREYTPLNYIYFLKDQEKLRQFSYFKTVDARIERIPNTLNQVNIIYKIEERNTGNLNVSVGVGTESRVNMQIGVYQDNLLGTGNVVSITTTKNRYQTYIDISMLKKYFGTKKVNISGKIFYNNFFADKKKKKKK